MTKLLEEAIEKLSQLPKERQNELAKMLIETAALDLQPYKFTVEERVAVEESLAQTERGEFASNEDVAAVWKRFGL
ncbi:MAG: hypothetical protein Q8R25_03500 [bacterium]|nr:hypothetical protein [bacterium]